MKRNFVYMSVLAVMDIFLMIRTEVFPDYIRTLFIFCIITFIAAEYMSTVRWGKKMWLARDKNSRLVLYKEKPVKLEESGVWVIPSDIPEDDYSQNCDLNLLEEHLPEGCDPKWEDPEPTEVKIITA